MHYGDAAFDFEGDYDTVMSGDFTDQLKGSMVEAVRSVYADLDDIIRRFHQTPQSISLTGVAKFLERFAGPRGNPGYIFTLNQDLFVKRRLPFENILLLPGLNKGERFNTRFNGVPANEAILRLPDEEAVTRFEQELPNQAVDLAYVKLHGSMEWASRDGSIRPVIGTQKTRLIDREPLLKWYGRLFRQALTIRPNRRLVVVGYGFRDPHINDTIAQACQNHGLRVYVVGTEDPQEFHRRLQGKGLWQQIWWKWAGYFRWTFQDLFPAGQGTAAGEVALKNLERAVFES